MKISNSVLVAIMLLITTNLFSQDFRVPAGQIKLKEDYAEYEKDIIAADKWLVATPFNEQKERREQVNGFIKQWVDGSPTVNCELNPIIFDFETKNPGMLYLFMGGCARYVLENNYSKDMRAKHKAALMDMITVYKAGKGIKKDKKMEKLIKAEEEGKLDEWLGENLKVGK